MAEQDVRPHQLSIAEIARLWSAETGDSADELQRELAEWAYAATADGAAVGTQDPKSAQDTSTKLKVEPDPERELRWDDVENFCRDRDRLVPHFWPGEAEAALADPEPGKGSAAVERVVPESGRSGEEISRLVIRAMDRLGTAAAAAERRAPDSAEQRASAAGNAGPATAGPRAVQTGDAVLTAADDTGTLVIERPEVAAPAPSAVSKAAPTEPGTQAEPPKPKPQDAAIARGRRRPIAKVMRASRAAASPTAARDPDTDFETPLVEVPVQVMRPGQAATTTPQSRRAPSTVPSLLAGVLFGAVVALMGAAVWLEVGGQDPVALLVGDSPPASEPGESERLTAQVATAEARVAEAARDSERLAGELGDARRQNDTLRARIADIGVLGERLSETQDSNAALRQQVADLNTALGAARAGGDANRQAIQADLDATRKDLEDAKAALGAAQAEATERGEALALARSDIGTAKEVGRQVEARADALAAELSAARAEAESLSTESQAAQATARRLEFELAAARQEIAALGANQDNLEASLANLDGELAETRARFDALVQANAAAERDRRRLGAELNAARQDADRIEAEKAAATAQAKDLETDLSTALSAIASLRSETESLNSQTARLTQDLAGARQAAETLSADRQAAEANAEDMARKLASAEDEAAALRASLEGTSGTAEQTAARLAAEQRRVAQLERDRTTALARIESLESALTATRTEAAELQASAVKAEDEKGLLLDALDGWKAEALALSAAQTGAARQASTGANAQAQARVEALTAALAATQAEVNNLQALAAKADSEKGLLLDAVDGWRAQALALTDALAAAETRTAVDPRPQAAPSKEALIGPSPDQSAETPKLRSITTLAAAEQASTSAAADADALGSSKSNPQTLAPAPQTARLDNPAGRMLTRGDEYLKRGDVASARLFYRQAADMGVTAALAAVARTYDPRALKALGVLVGFADPDTAADWYERAIAAGDGQADKDLATLRAWLKP